MHIEKNDIPLIEGYPVLISPYGIKYPFIYYMCGLPHNFHEWYGFKNIGDGKYFGFIYGDTGEPGYFSKNEIERSDSTGTTDPDDLIELKPPPGWEMEKGLYRPCNKIEIKNSYH